MVESKIEEQPKKEMIGVYVFSIKNCTDEKLYDVKVINVQTNSNTFFSSINWPLFMLVFELIILILLFLYSKPNNKNIISTTGFYIGVRGMGNQIKN